VRIARLLVPCPNNGPFSSSQVCELDLVFSFHRVTALLDEIILGGEVSETSKKAILDRVEEIERFEK